MLEADQQFIDEITRYLRKLPDINARRERHESWRTAKEIACWWSQDHGEYRKPETIDELLRSWWLIDPKSREIRPAKYPDKTTGCRLWGNVQCVGKLSEAELQMFRMDRPVELETISLVHNAPLFFLSYAAPDLHFAARVRLSLGAYGIRSWMYSAEIEEGSLVFEGVGTALSAAQRVIALSTPLSLPSAWMETELQVALEKNKPITIAFDSSKAVLMELLESWHPSRANNERFFNSDLLLKLEDEYARHYSQTRVEKYKASMTNFLQSFKPGEYQVCIYPRKPTGWTGHEYIIDFEKAISDY